MSELEFVANLKTNDIRKANFEVVIDNYIKYYASDNGHTARAKQLDLSHFLNFLAKLKGYASPEKLIIDDWDASSVNRFIDDSLNNGEAPATVCRRLATLKHMGRTLAESIPGFINPARAIKNPKTNILRPKALKADEINELKAKAKSLVDNNPNSFNKIRNEALFCLLLDTGLRADEVRLLRFNQIDEDLEWIHNVRTKGRRYRNVYITSDIRPLLKQYLAAREKKLCATLKKELTHSESRSLPFFISLYRASLDKPESFLMGAKSIWRVINQLSSHTHLHPHILRHSFAMDLIEHATDIRLVAQALGHSDVRTTMRYTERRQEDIAEALERSRRLAKEENNSK